MTLRRRDVEEIKKDLDRSDTSPQWENATVLDLIEYAERRVRFLRTAIEGYIQRPGCNGPARANAMRKLQWALDEDARP